MPITIGDISFREYRCQFCGWRWRQDDPPKTCRCIKREFQCPYYTVLFDNGYKVRWRRWIVREGLGFMHMRYEAYATHFLNGPVPYSAYQTEPIHAPSSFVTIVKVGSKPRSKPLSRCMHRLITGLGL